MDIIQALVLGVVEGITEFLPISSTAHLMAASTLLGLPQSTFVKTFEIAIQLGAILAVVALYWRSFLDIKKLSYIATAFLPTAIIGFALYPFIKDSLIGNLPLALATLAAGGVVLIVFEYWHRGCKRTRTTEMTYWQALIVGMAQAVAVVPGVSRSAATIVGGLALGIERRTITEFSFLLAAPTMAAATAYDLLKNYQSFSTADFGVLAVGFVASFAVALGAITWLLRYVQTHDFTAFGLYRIVAAAALFLLLWR